MKLLSLLFPILLVLKEFNCAPLFDSSDYMERWQMGMTDCGFGGSYHYGLHSRPWLFRKYVPRVTYLSDYERMSNEDQLSKETEDQLSKETADQLSKKTADKPSNKALDKPIDIPTKPLVKPLIDISSKTLDEPSRKFLDKPSTNSLEELLDYEKVSPLDDMPAENLDDFSKSF